MKKTDKIGLSEKTAVELITLIAAKRKEQVENKSKQFLGNLKDTSIFRKLRREIAVISTHLSKLK
ncbi:MAG: 50S ribosomal protein L29 [Candidatus Shapirobacteria bacterium]